MSAFAGRGAPIAPNADIWLLTLRMSSKAVCRKIPREVLQQAMLQYISTSLCCTVSFNTKDIYFKPPFLFYNAIECTNISKYVDSYSSLDYSPCEDCFSKPTRICFAAAWGCVITSHSQHQNNSSWAEPFHVATRTPCTHTEYLGGKCFPPTDKWTS